MQRTVRMYRKKKEKEKKTKQGEHHPSHRLLETVVLTPSPMRFAKKDNKMKSAKIKPDSYPKIHDQFFPT